MSEDLGETVAYLGAADVRSLADRLGVRPTKTLGQNFVHDAGTVRRIVRTAAVAPGDWVLEVGPGLGSLTLGLLDAGAHVTAVEIDPVLVRALPGTAAERCTPVVADRLAVLLRDAMDVAGPDDLPVPGSLTAADEAGATTPAGPTKLVANLPYNVAVPVILTLLEHLPSLREVLVMVQAEVADRLAAPPGSRTYGVPSAKAAWWTDATRVGTIGRAVFWPAPNVDSALVRLVRREPPGDEALRRATFAVIDAAFAQRRKTLRQALAPWAGSPADAERLLRAAGVDPGARGERLAVDQFVAVARAGSVGGAREATQSSGHAVAGEELGAAWEVPKATNSPGNFVAGREGVTVRAPAKINLTLRVGAPRPDGYHPLVTVFEALDLTETVTATLIPAGPDGSPDTGPDAPPEAHRAPDPAPITAALAPDSALGHGLDMGEANLLVRAAHAVRDAAAERGTPVPHGAHLTVRKVIPVAGGLAGGSADAAAALVACDALWGTELGADRLHELARSLGADVPFALEGGVALGTDRGDRLTRADVAPGTRHHWVLAVSAEGLSTPAVFRHLDAHFPAPAEPAPADALLAVLAAPVTDADGAPLDPDSPGIGAARATALAPHLVNDLTDASLDLRPDLADVVDACHRAGALAVLLCGSGPTIAALCVDAEHARSVAAVVRAAEVASDVIVTAGPADGARQRVSTVDSAAAAAGGSGESQLST